MGIYNDHQHTNRLNWEYTYTGAELLEPARRKHREYLGKEKTAREKMAQLMLDMSVSQSDTYIAECKKEIERSGTERERCAVWVHEFERHPEKTYTLELGDVTYFDLAPEPE